MPQADLELLKLVFTRHTMLKLAHVDARLLPEERALLDETCPPGTFEDQGLLEDDGTLTAAWVEHLEEAREILPDQLSLADKLAMITRFVDMAVIDGDLHHEEGRLLLEAATDLGVDPEDFDTHLDGLTDQVGHIEATDMEVTEGDL